MSAKNLGFVGVALAFLLGGSPYVGLAQTPIQAPEIPVEEIIRRFSEKEKQFKVARENYVFRQEVRFEELNAAGQPTGEFRTVTDVSFDEKGRRTEKLIFAPAPTLQKISISPEDMKDLREIQPFVLTSDEIAKYSVKYGGKEAVDEITCYVFDVSPKKLEKGERYFEGKIWVDDRDFQIVKTYGKAVPDIRSKDGKNENLFPKFETYRQQIDQYWFPTYTRALDTLEFADFRQRIREIIRYTDYKKFQTTVQLKFGDVVTDDKAGASETPKPAVEDKTAPVLDPKYKTDPKDTKKK